MSWQAKTEPGECPKTKALGATLKQKYGYIFFSGYTVFQLPVRDPKGEAKIRLKRDPPVHLHQEFALRGERKEAMEKILAVNWQRLARETERERSHPA